MITKKQFQRSQTIQRQTGRTFYVATRFLPPGIRDYTHVLYAFFRIADEVVDNPNPDPPSHQREQLYTIRAAAMGEIATDNPVLQAFCTVRVETGIPDLEVEEFIQAMLADVSNYRYDTFEDLESYLRGSAVAVAYMMLSIMDPADQSQAKPHAKALGEAFQLTNFLRDVREDVTDYGRIYLPIETLERFGVSEAEIATLDYSTRFRRVMHTELERTEERYRQGVSGISMLPSGCQFPVLLAAILYAEHHAKIRALQCNVLEHRPTLNYIDYLRLIAQTWWYWKRLGDPEAVFYRVSAISRKTDRETDSESVVGDTLPPVYRGRFQTPEFSPGRE